MSLLQKIKKLSTKYGFIAKQINNDTITIRPKAESLPVDVFTIHLARNFVVVDSCVPLNLHEELSQTVVYEEPYNVMLSELNDSLRRLHKLVTRFLQLSAVSGLPFKRLRNPVATFACQVKGGCTIRIGLGSTGFLLQLFVRPNNELTSECLQSVRFLAETFETPIVLVPSSEVYRKLCVIE